MKGHFSNGKKSIVDDFGNVWRVRKTRSGHYRVRMDGDDTLPADSRGYYCDDYADAERILARDGFISARAGNRRTP